MRYPMAQLIRRLRGYGSAGFTRPRASTRGYTKPQLRCFIRKPCSMRFLGLPTPTAASQLSPKSQHCWRTGFFEIITGHEAWERDQLAGRGVGEAVRYPTAQLIRRLRGYGSAGFTGPRASTRGYTKPQLRCFIRKPCSMRFLGLPTPTAASQLSPKSQHCGRTGFFEIITGHEAGERDQLAWRGVGEAVCYPTAQLIRRLRGYGSAGFTGPRASTRGYTKPQLRCSVRKACRGRPVG